MAAAGAWDAAGGLDFEVEAGDFGAGVVASAGVIPRMDTMAIHPIEAFKG
jgi:hypothetical protein